MKAVLVQANIRQVPAHVRLTNDRVGLTDPGKISAEIFTQQPDGTNEYKLATYLRNIHQYIIYLRSFYYNRSLINY